MGVRCAALLAGTHALHTGTRVLLTICHAAVAGLHGEEDRVHDGTPAYIGPRIEDRLQIGDILTDLGAARSGSLGVVSGANINPGRQHPSMVEPIHGSTPDIVGRSIANPIERGVVGGTGRLYPTSSPTA